MKLPEPLLLIPHQKLRTGNFREALTIVRRRFPTATMEGSTGLGRSFHISNPRHLSSVVAVFDPYWHGTHRGVEGGWLYLSMIPVAGAPFVGETLPCVEGGCDHLRTEHRRGSGGWYCESCLTARKVVIHHAYRNILSPVQVELGGFA